MGRSKYPTVHTEENFYCEIVITQELLKVIILEVLLDMMRTDHEAIIKYIKHTILGQYMVIMQEVSSGTIVPLIQRRH